MCNRTYYYVTGLVIQDIYRYDKHVPALKFVCHGLEGDNDSLGSSSHMKWAQSNKSTLYGFMMGLLFFTYFVYAIQSLIPKLTSQWLLSLEHEVGTKQ